MRLSFAEIVKPSANLRVYCPVKFAACMRNDMGGERDGCGGFMAVKSTDMLKLNLCLGGGSGGLEGWLGLHKEQA
jgi:hypothetical protein